MLCINSAGGNDQDVQRRIELARSYVKILDRDLWKSCISLPSKIRLQNFIHHLCDHVWCRCLEPDSGITRDVCMRSTSSAYGTFSASRIQLMLVILKSAWELGSFWLQNSSSRDDSNCLAMLPELTKLKITSVRWRASLNPPSNWRQLRGHPCQTWQWIISDQLKHLSLNLH